MYEVCKQLEARLATHTELVDAYNAGADWRTLSWGKDQKAYYVSQTTGNGFQKGVIGGKLPPQLSLGAMCYGIKPNAVTCKKYDIH